MDKKRILITGAAGFIGSHVARLFINKYPEYEIYNLDKLTYAGNLENLKDIDKNSNYKFILGDIVDSELVNNICHCEVHWIFNGPINMRFGC